jgi:hypothetical protein
MVEAIKVNELVKNNETILDELTEKLNERFADFSNQNPEAKRFVAVIFNYEQWVNDEVFVGMLAQRYLNAGWEIFSMDSDHTFWVSANPSDKNTLSKDAKFFYMKED